jgi:TPR repeat protein
MAFAFERGQTCYASDDYARARSWYVLAAELGHGEAKLLLGYMHYAGLGGPTDRAAAARWYADAATHGVVEAYVLLGMMHEHGSGVPVDRRAACQVYLRAALQGHSGAAFRLASLES